MLPATDHEESVEFRSISDIKSRGYRFAIVDMLRNRWDWVGKEVEQVS